jgi:preprotein translocase subunit SecG
MQQPDYFRASIQAPNFSQVIWIHIRVSIMISIVEAVSEQEVTGASRGRNTGSLRILFWEEGTPNLFTKLTFN